MNKTYAIPGNSGICRCCFNPIISGEESGSGLADSCFVGVASKPIPQVTTSPWSAGMLPGRKRKRPNAPPLTKARHIEPHIPPERLIHEFYHGRSGLSR